MSHIPSNRKSLKEIKGFGRKKLDAFGDELLDLLIAYRRDHGMDILPPEEPAEKNRKPKIDSKQLSYDLWKQGKDIEEIAVARGFSPVTIEGHLAHFVETGELNIESLLEKDRIEMIKREFLRSESLFLKEVKEQLGESVSYRELKFVKSHLVKLGKIGQQ
ncbi:MAG: helix-turn-helix domain-containing protein [Bacteroidota bacterium]|nr:helix-turn-helix domain-containing protein [Bacteroidota bacterium]